MLSFFFVLKVHVFIQCIFVDVSDAALLKRVFATAQSENATLTAGQRAASLSLSKSVSDKYSAQIAAMQSMRDPLDVISVRRLFASHKAAFVDFLFAPSSSSIGIQDSPLLWRRVSEIMEGTVYVFEKEIEPNDIVQGELVCSCVF